MKLFRRLTIILSVLALLILCVCGVVASAAENEQTGDGPRIVSKNISYASYLHIYYAIPSMDVNEGETVSIDFYRENPALGGEAAYTSTNYTIEKITSITGSPETYYVLGSKGIAPRLGTCTLWAVPVVTDANGVRTEGEAVPYSVAEYCFERLAAGGYINVGQSNNIDSHRRELYLATLSYIHYSQEALVEDYTTIPKLAELGYIAVTDGSFGGISCGIVDTSVTHTVTASPDKPEGYTFTGWDITSFDIFGNTEHSTSASTVYNARFTAGGAIRIKAVYDLSPEAQRAEEIAAQQKLDNIEKARQWDNLEAAFVTKLGYSKENARDLTEALETLYTLYGQEMVTWVASLYAKGFNDIETGRWAGGFYASTAGRDAAGYGPDLQCTVQLLRFLLQSGVISSIEKDIPTWMAQEMIYFAKTLQDPNGYFYHPQWGKAFTDTKISRRGRDLGWGTTLLSFWGEKPTYDTPSGTKGNGETAEDYLERIGVSLNTAPTPLTASISTSIVCAVSRVVSVSDSADESTAYFKSHTAFINYLLTSIAPGMRTGPYSTGNTLNATSGQIGNYSNILGPYTYTAGDEALTAGATAADYLQFDGMTMKEMLLKVLDDAINPNTGLFGGYNAETGEFSGMESINFSNTNGFFKVISIYNSWKHAYPSAALAAVGLISNLTNPDLPSRGNACDVYNVWNAIGSLKSNSSSSETVWAIEGDGFLAMCDEGEAGATSMTVKAFIIKTLELRGADAVRITYDKIKGYKKSDGAFSHSYTSGVTSHQGCPVSPAGYNVSDVDATCIASTGLVRSIFTAFAMDSYKPNFFGKADYMRFIDYIEAADPVYKSAPEDVTDTFDTTERQNVITGDATILDGTLIISGDSTIERSPYATKGIATVFSIKADIPAGTHSFSFLTGNDTVAVFDAVATSDNVRITNRYTGSYVNIQTGGYISLSFEFRLNGDELTLAIIRNSTVLYEENLPKSAHTVIPASLTKINRVNIATSSEITVDSLCFATITPSYQIKDESGRINFDGLGLGEIDLSKYSSSITFTNGTSGQNISRALIVSEGDNKFLRLEDNWSDGSVTAQNYFDFKGTAAPCDTAVFEAKMRITTSNAGVIPITVLSNTGNAAYYGAMKISGGYLWANVACSKATRTSDMQKTTVKAGEWFYVRLEYTAADTYSEDSFLCSIYINGVLIDSDNTEQDGLTYAASSNISKYRMACDTNWSGNLDYDMIYVGSKERYTPPSDITTPSDIHIHTPSGTAIENLDDFTCTADGSREAVKYCTDNTCGAEISRVFVTLPASHRAGEVVFENVNNMSCKTDGKHDEVVYCTECGEEMSRITITTLAAHTSGEAVEENYVACTCTASGSVDRVNYCTECGEELRRIKVIIAPSHAESEYYNETIADSTCATDGSYYRVTICSVCKEELDREIRLVPKTPHTIVGGACTECGGTNFIIDGVITFEDIEPTAVTTSSSTKVGSYSSIGTTVYFKAAKDITTASVVSEDGNKYISLDKYDNSSATNTWVDIFRDTTRDVSIIYFESKINLSTVNTGGGVYIRLYKGRTSSNSGTRVTYHTMSRSGDYITYAGTQTHLKYDEWGTIRITLEATDTGYLYTFFAKNETGSPLTYKNVSYADGEFIPYFTTTTLEKDANLTSISEVCGITFMQSTASIATLRLDDVYFGGKPNFISAD